MAKDLNLLLAYSKLKPICYRSIDIAKLKDNPIKSEDDWGSNEFSSLKRNFRYQHYKTQKRRCSYCRRKLNSQGINEHIDHLVAKSIKKGWMFKPRNLVLACYQCNTQKSNKSAFLEGQKFKRLPKKAHNYTIFNPYVDKWSDHFEIEDELFIKARSIKGQDTITILKLFDFKYSIEYADELNIFGDTAIKRAAKRLNKFPANSIEFKSADKLIKEIERHI
jgi:uncharacterized protein (TIGR02646 family)